MMFRSFCMGKKDNDREINEWYNEVNWDYSPRTADIGKWFLQRFWIRFLLYNFRKAGKTLGFDKTKKAYCEFL